MTDTAVASSVNVAPGSVVVVRDEEWLVTGVDHTQDGWLLRVQGLSELVRDTTAAFYSGLDLIEVLDPAQAVVVADDSHYYRRSRLWLESTLRKTAVPLDGPSLTVSTEMLADTLEYQLSAVRQALDPANLRTRILLADAVGLGKTLEIGMILSELIRRGRGERILIVSPRHVLEQMQHEMWCRFAIPFVRLDSVGIQRVRQKLPATRNPFTYFKRVIISIDTLKSDRYIAALRHHRWDAVVIDEARQTKHTVIRDGWGESGPSRAAVEESGERVCYGSFVSHSTRVAQVQIGAQKRAGAPRCDCGVICKAIDTVKQRTRAMSERVEDCGGFGR